MTRWESYDHLNYLYYISPQGRVPVGHYNVMQAWQSGGRWRATFLGHGKSPAESRDFTSREEVVAWLEAKFKCAHRGNS